MLLVPPKLPTAKTNYYAPCVSDHTFIDVPKIDIEGGEFDALTACVNSHTQGDLSFGQPSIEFLARKGHQRFDQVAR